MKRLVLVSLFVAMTAGCNSGWRPFSRGGSCGPACGGLPTLPQAPLTSNSGCVGCGDTVTSGYSSYPGTVIDGGYIDGGYGAGEIISGDYYGGSVIGGGIVGETIPSPSMAPVRPAP